MVSSKWSFSIGANSQFIFQKVWQEKQIFWGGGTLGNSGPHTCQADALPLEPLHPPFFVKGFIQDRVSELFAQADLQPWFSQSQPAR
jgi:hypothetical protein